MRDICSSKINPFPGRRMEEVADPGNSYSLGRGQSSWLGETGATHRSVTTIWGNAHRVKQYISLEARKGTKINSSCLLKQAYLFLASHPFAAYLKPGTWDQYRTWGKWQEGGIHTANCFRFLCLPSCSCIYLVYYHQSIVCTVLDLQDTSFSTRLWKFSQLIFAFAWADSELRISV